ncbi:MAG: hypothetical protein QXL94_01725 [Candidatus Parvarchaeum sp.]
MPKESKHKLLKVVQDFREGFQKEEKYVCEICGKEFSGERDWFVHMAMHTYSDIEEE